MVLEKVSQATELELMCSVSTSFLLDEVSQLPWAAVLYQESFLRAAGG